MNTKKGTIFVSLASYRDKSCLMTLRSLFKNAENPSRIFVGVCQQNKPEDQDCLNDFDSEYKQNIRVIRIPHHQAKGPTAARYLCSTLFDSEEYYVQIDSHITFVPNWDRLCIDMIQDLKGKGVDKAVLSYYPSDWSEEESYHKNKEEVKYLVPRMCRSFFNDRGMISYEGSEHVHTKNELHETSSIAAGFFFCESKFLKYMAFDNTLDYIFVGEEVLLSIRFWTHGWNIYCPREHICWHYYTRSDDPKIWTDRPDYSDSVAFDKIKELLELIEKKGRVSEEYIKYYGLGKKRTLNEYYTFAGINTKTKTVNKDFCRENFTSENIVSNGKRECHLRYFHMILLLLLLLFFILSCSYLHKRSHNIS